MNETSIQRYLSHFIKNDKCSLFNLLHIHLILDYYIYH